MIIEDIIIVNPAEIHEKCGGNYTNKTIAYSYN